MAGDALTPGQAEFVQAQRVARLATIYADGTPHVVPISPVLDVDRLIFATELDTQKAHNLQGDPHVALVFDEYSEDWRALRGVVVFGRAMVSSPGPSSSAGGACSTASSSSMSRSRRSSKVSGPSSRSGSTASPPTACDDPGVCSARSGS